MPLYRRRLLAAVLALAWAASLHATDISVPRGEAVGQGQRGQAGAGALKTAPGANLATGGQLSLDLRGGIGALQGAPSLKPIAVLPPPTLADPAPALQSPALAPQLPAVDAMIPEAKPAAPIQSGSFGQLGAATEKLTSAQKVEDKGSRGAIAAALNTVFDVTKLKADARGDVVVNAKAGAFKESALAPHTGTLQRLSEAAYVADALKAPALYQHAAAEAEKRHHPATIKNLKTSVAFRGPQALQDVLAAALKLSQLGVFSPQSQASVFSALKFWNESLIYNSQPALPDLAAVQKTFVIINAQAKQDLTAAAGFSVKVLQVFDPAGKKVLEVSFPKRALPKPPEPLKTVLANLWQDAKDALSDAWQSSYAAVTSRAWWKELFGLQGPQYDTLNVAVDAPQVKALKKQLERDDSAPLTVHAPRKFVRRALGYRLSHGAPEGVASDLTTDQTVTVKIARGGSEASLAGLRRRFGEFNRLIEANFAALELVAQNSTHMTVKNARAIAANVKTMAEAYQALAEDASQAEEYVAAVAAVAAKIDALAKGLADQELLPAKAVALVVPIDQESLHRYINLIHQQALESVGRSKSSSPANMFLRLENGSHSKDIALVDLSNDPLAKDGRIVSPGLKALVNALSDAHDTPNGSLIMQDHQFWGHFQLGAHSAEVYANFLPPDEGGMLRVRYQEWGTSLANESRLYYVSSLLRKVGFAVEEDNGFLTAIVDKDHQSQTVDRMMENFSLVIQALHSTVGVDFALPIILEGSTSEAESARRIDAWVDIALAEGNLPFYVNDEHVKMVAGYNDYKRDEMRREELREGLVLALQTLGLPTLPSGRLGQRLIDQHFNGPIEAAIARGEVRIVSGGGLTRNRDYDPLSALAVSFAENAVSGARMAEAVGSLDHGLFDFKAIGSIGALTLERAQRRIDSDKWLNLYVLRDPQTGQAVLARAELGTLDMGLLPRALPPEALFHRLAQQGHPVAAFTPSDVPAGGGLTMRKLKQEPVASSSPGEVFSGLAASPGRGRTITARVTYDKAKAASGGYIFVAAYTTPDDLDSIRNSRAVVTTSGGLLSHAAITTREMGISALILSQAAWQDGAVSLEWSQFNTARRVRGLAVRSIASSRRIQLKEGAVVRLDPVSGQLEVFPEPVQEGLLAASLLLQRYDESPRPGSLSRAVEEAMKADALGALQKMAFAREVLSELVQRTFGRPEAAFELERTRQVLHAPALGRLSAWVKQSETDLFTAEARAAQAQHREAIETLRETESIEAVERAVLAAAGRQNRLQELALAFQRDAAEFKTSAHAFRGLNEAAKERLEALLKQDIAELERHAHDHPSVTLEVLPRIKALIAKAKRRKLAPSYYREWEAQVTRLEEQRLASRRAKAPAVLSLAEVLDMDVPWVGGKASKLGEIMQVVRKAGGSVPPGVALTIHAYRAFLREAGIEAQIDAIGSEQGLSIEERSGRIRQLILRAALSESKGVGREILRAVRREGLDKEALAVRSSAVDEDGADAAFAGAGDTHLYVDNAALLQHVKEVWASLWNPRALLYRQTKGLSLSNLNQAVVIQMMAPSEVSGVAFTQDPVSGNTARLVVNAAFGLGEGIVSGRVAPDQYVVGKKLGREILPAMIADKKLAIVRDASGKGVAEKRMAPERRRARSLTPKQLELLNTVAVALERHFGYALDLEWGFVGDKLYILQSRPITKNAEAPTPAQP